MMRAIIIIILLSLTSCNPAKWCAKRFPPSVSEIEKIEIKEIVRDSIIYIPGDSVIIVDSILCPEKINKSFSKSSSKATIKVDIKDNIITAEAVCDSLEKVIQLKDKEITTLKERKEVQIIPKEYIPKYFLWSGVILPFLLLLLVILYKFKKFPF